MLTDFTNHSSEYLGLEIVGNITTDFNRIIQLLIYFDPSQVLEMHILRYIKERCINNYSTLF